ncbi:MAG: type II toxin-antitoxin system VapC family toxin [Actinobacteria bacterium]|nr:type II toxin-antitoxin system VapC family toxin [Actinomycetota bacterium]
MISYFIDTSALFKRYVPEQGTEEMDRIFSQDAAFYISDITIVEFISNLKRKNEITGELNEDLYKKIKSELFADITGGKIKTEGVISETIIEAIDLLDKNYITPLDSLQLASALQLQSEKGSVIFLCSDKKLFSLAEKCGLKPLLLC